VDWRSRLKQKGIAAVLDVRDDAFLKRAHCIALILDCRLDVLRPISPLGVEHKAKDVWVLPTPPAHVDPPEGRGTSVRQLPPRRLVGLDVSDSPSKAVERGEADTGVDIEALPDAIFLI
jgi:hypothetical protein